MKQVNNFIKTLFHELSDDGMRDSLDTLCSEYTDLNNKNCHFDGDVLIWKSKYIQEGNRHLWYQNYSLLFIKVLGLAE